MPRTMWNFIWIALVVVLIYKLLLLVSNVIISRVARPMGMGVSWTSDQGEYVMVVGATGSMGSAYTKMFASMHFNLVLVSNNGEKLKALAESTKEKYKLKDVILIEVDLTKEESFAAIKNRLSTVAAPIVALVNAAGVSQPNQSFDQLSPESVSKMLTVNVNATVRIIQIVLPGMISKNRGTIINFSSFVGKYYFPNYSLYGATKAFLHSFSVALQMECKKYNVTVQIVAPFVVRSKVSPEVKENCFFALPSGEVGFEAMRVVGVKTTTHGHWKHMLACSCMSLVSLFLGRTLASRIFNAFRFFFLVAIKTNTEKPTTTTDNKTIEKSFKETTESYKSLEKTSKISGQ